MNISTHLRAGLWILAAVIVTVTVLASHYLFTLGNAVNVILRENVESVLAARKMGDALARMRGEAVGAVLDGRAVAADEIAHLNDRFLEGLLSAERLITLEGEREILKRVRANRGRVVEQIAENGRFAQPDERRAHLSGTLERTFQMVGDDLDSLVEMNTTAIFRADAATKGMAQNHSFLLGLLCLTGLFVAFHFHRRIGDSFVDPLRGISLMAARMSHGDFTQRLPENREDEFGRLAVEVNRLLERMDINNEENRAYAIGQRQIASALIERFGEPALLLDNLGDVVIANAPARTIVTGPEGAGALLAIRGALGESADFENEGLVYRPSVEPLLTASKKMCGSLVRLAIVPSAKAPS